MKEYITEQDLAFLRARAKDRILCICGRTFIKDNMTNHYRTKIHHKLIEKNLNNNASFPIQKN